MDPLLHERRIIHSRVADGAGARARETPWASRSPLLQWRMQTAVPSALSSKAEYIESCGADVFHSSPSRAVSYYADHLFVARTTRSSTAVVHALSLLSHDLAGVVCTWLLFDVVRCRAV
jgi:hypothetical protein